VEDLDAPERPPPGSTSSTTSLPSFPDLHREATAALRHMRRQCEQGASARSQVMQDFQASSLSVEELTQQTAALTQQLKFFTEFKDYLEDLADCYEAKERVIQQKVEELRELHVDYFRDRMDTFRKDLKDEMEAVNIAMGLQEQEEEEVDEFGRSLVRVKQARALRRRERCRRRQEHRARHTHLQDQPEGWSTEGSDSGDEDRYGERIRAHLQGLGTVFADAGAEFASLNGIHERLQRFRLQFGKAYHDAYINLSLSMAFGPHVAIELAAWNPLKRHVPLSEFPFYRTLCDFGGGPDAGSTELDLVPQLLTEQLVPLATLYLANAYDPLSERHTRNARALVVDLLNHLSPTSRPMKQLLFAVVDTIKTTAAALSVDHTRLRFDPPDQRPGSTTPAAAAFGVVRRRCWMAVKLLHNTGHWRGVLHPVVLHNIGLKHLLVGRILPHLRTLALGTRDALRDTVAVLRQCLDRLPPIPSDWHRDPALQPHVAALHDFVQRHLVTAYGELSRDATLEADLAALWGQAGGDPSALNAALRALP